MSFNDGDPQIPNTIVNDIVRIEENTSFLKETVEEISGGWSDGSTTHLVPGNNGDMSRAKFSYNSSTSIKISPAVYHHSGTATDQMVYWDSDITKTIANFLGGEYTYIYLHDSAIGAAGTNIISSSQIYSSIFPPTWSNSKHGWYGSNYRCIFACYCDSDTSIVPFYHDGGRKVLYDSPIEIQTLAQLSSGWTDVTCKSPGFSRMSSLQCKALGGNGATSESVLRMDGGGIITRGITTSMGTGYNIFGSSITHFDLPTDSTQQLQSAYIGVKPAEYSLSSLGWYLPNGM